MNVNVKWTWLSADVNHKLPTGKPQCKPKKLVPFYSADGTKDWFYGAEIAPCLSYICIYKRSIYQDRLGANIKKRWEKR